MPKDNPNKKGSQLKAILKRVQKMDRRVTTYERIIEDSLTEFERLEREKNILEKELEALKNKEPQIIYHSIEDDPMCGELEEILAKYDTKESNEKVKEYEGRLNRTKYVQSN